MGRRRVRREVGKTVPVEGGAIESNGGRPEPHANGESVRFPPSRARANPHRHGPLRVIGGDERVCRDERFRVGARQYFAPAVETLAKGNGGRSDRHRTVRAGARDDGLRVGGQGRKAEPVGSGGHARLVWVAWSAPRIPDRRP
jgi:hypothetical protein